MSILDLAAVDVAERIRRGEFSSEDYVRACIERIQGSDDTIRAWAYLDADRALEQARWMDELRRHGQPLGLLHGVPVGVKDVFDSRDMPTAFGTADCAGRRSAADAAVVEKLREAGAVILGKTATTEHAFLQPAATRNPHDTGRSPGGSSSGSAAAVAAGHVPLAVGTQASGSVIRPAAYCGVHGFKPSRGIISRRGSLQTSQSLDQVGVFGRCLRDVARLADALAGYDAADGASFLRPRPRMYDGCLAEVPIEPSFAWFDLPFNDRLSGAAREGFEELLESLGGHAERLPAPRTFQTVVEAHTVVREYELYRNLGEDVERHGERVGRLVRDAVTRGAGHGEQRYRAALALLAGSEDYFARFFCDYDAIVTPAAAGEAPALGAGTEDPIFCTIWTFSGLPCLSLPLLVGETGLPVGVQLVGSSNGDDRLLRSASWLVRHIREQESNHV